MITTDFNPHHRTKLTSITIDPEKLLAFIEGHIVKKEIPIYTKLLDKEQPLTIIF